MIRIELKPWFLDSSFVTGIIASVMAVLQLLRVVDISAAEQQSLVDAVSAVIAAGALIVSIWSRATQKTELIKGLSANAGLRALPGSKGNTVQI